MVDRAIFLSGVIIFLIITSMGVASEKTGETIKIEGAEIEPLSIIQGRLSLLNYEDKEYVILTTANGEHYALRGKLAEEQLRPLKDLENKKTTLAGIPSPLHKRVIETKVEYDSIGEFKSRTDEAIEYSNFLVLYIEKIEEAKSEAVFPVKRELGPEKPILSSSEAYLPTLQRISGKVISANFKSVIPTIELEGKPDFVIMIPADVEAIKVVGENLMAFKPKGVLKEGTKVEIWYEEKGYIRNARIITIQEKDITSQSE